VPGEGGGNELNVFCWSVLLEKLAAGCEVLWQVLLAYWLGFIGVTMNEITHMVTCRIIVLVDQITQKPQQ
jgi:hypothetical protein